MTTKTILIAEDDTTTASLVAAYLEREGFSTVIASDGENCLREFRAHEPVLGTGSSALGSDQANMLI